MFLSIDAGNSNIVFSFYESNTQSWTREFRVETRRNINEREIEQKVSLFLLEEGLYPTAIRKIGISSVVPEINRSLEGFCHKVLGLKPYIISGRSYGKLPVSTTKPDEIGSDLMANVMAAYTHFGRGCIVVDFGTALTFTVVDDGGLVIGVTIAPGIKTAIQALSTNTSKLPEVKLEVPPSILGKDTVHSIQAGILYGYTGLVNGMLDAIHRELGVQVPVMATGGLSKILPQLERRFDKVDRNLTLEGIRLITEANT